MAVGYNSDAPPEGALHAKVAELVDAQDLGSCGATRESSSLSFRTTIERGPFAQSPLAHDRSDG